MLDHRQRLLRQFGWSDPLGGIDPCDWEGPMLNENMIDTLITVPPAKSSIESLILKALESDERWQYRSMTALRGVLKDEFGVDIAVSDLGVLLKQLVTVGQVVESKQTGHWGSVARLTAAGVMPVEMSKDERSTAEQDLWDKAHPLPSIPLSGPEHPAPIAFLTDAGVTLNPNYSPPTPGPKNQIRYPDVTCDPACLPSGPPMCESANEGFVGDLDANVNEIRKKLASNLEFVGDEGNESEEEVQRRLGIVGNESKEVQYRIHMRNSRTPKKELIVFIDHLPVPHIVKALADALAHSREVAQREHIKADRIERVNQFIVSLRRHFGYMSDQYRTEREFLAAQLARKEVWYDAGVLNPVSLTGFNANGLGGSSPTSLKHRDVENWLAQAEAMTPSYGDLKAEIEKDLQRLKGSILVAETCNKTTGEINKNADKVLSEMAALAADM